ncbi:MAG: hypothetical protein LBP35_02350 [Candidatus Ancillula trichonymphae]|nr:hypothetical protein [Candidatus Ancillula trichonymphae]
MIENARRSAETELRECRAAVNEELESVRKNVERLTEQEQGITIRIKELRTLMSATFGDVEIDEYAPTS